LAGEQGLARLTPHSRYYGLLQSDLEFAGYDVLTSSPVHGVDSFTKSVGSQFVFLQGHPEYDANSLAREYLRDMRLYLGGETDRSPARPQGYFTAEAEMELRALELRLREASPSVAIEDLSKIDALAPTEAPWRDPAISFCRSWIETIVSAACGRSAEATGAGPPTFQNASGRDDARQRRGVDNAFV
jgi:homoserine O-succinyltransferase